MRTQPFLTAPHALLVLASSIALAACGAAPASSPKTAVYSGDAAPTAVSSPAGGDGEAAAFEPPAAPASEESEADTDGPAEASPPPPPMAAPAPAPARAAAGAPAPSIASERADRALALRPTADAFGVVPAVRAGEWDDNANYRDFLRYLRTQQGLGFRRLDVRDRQVLVVRDAEGKAVPGCPVTVRDETGRGVTLTTLSSGRALLFPHAEGLAEGRLLATATCANATARAAFTAAEPDRLVDLRLAAPRSLPEERRVDIAFILDTTGSMGEEIAATKATVQKVVRGLDAGDVVVRLGMVEFRDRTDAFVTRVYPMTRDAARFARDVARIEADGGGDAPENVEMGLHVAVRQLDWDEGAVARLAFLIGDAPPHLDYQQTANYADDVREAARRGIQVHTIAASGMDSLGQVVWRQIAQYTGGSNMFVLRGGAGPQSTGAGDAKSGCGGTHTNYTSGGLDALILAKVRGAVRAVDADPLRVPGLGQDENAKPCAERLLVAGG